MNSFAVVLVVFLAVSYGLAEANPKKHRSRAHHKENDDGSGVGAPPGSPPSGSPPSGSPPPGFPPPPGPPGPNPASQDFVDLFFPPGSGAGGVDDGDAGNSRNHNDKSRRGRKSKAN